MKYAVQVRWPDGRWTYVMKPWSMEERDVFDTRKAAETMAAAWRKPGHEDAVRVVPLEPDVEVVARYMSDPEIPEDERNETIRRIDNILRGLP